MKHPTTQHPTIRNSYEAHSRHTPHQSPRAIFSSRKQTPQKVFIFALILVAFMGLIWLLQGLSLPALASGNASQDARSFSTPQSEWTKGSIPALYQTDPLWESTTYNNGSKLGTSGCGPTCLSMVYTALTGNVDYGPKEMFLFAHEQGYMSEEGTQWIFFTEGAQTLGLIGEELAPTEQVIRENLIAGKPIICSMGPGDFTTSGHLIVLTGIDQQHRLIVQDPNSPERSARGWDFDTVISQCRNMWAFSAA